MRRDIFVFSTSLNTDTDVESISPVLNRCSKIKVWSVDLEDADNVLQVECQGLSASDIIGMLNANGYTCEELEYLPSEIKARHRILKKNCDGMWFLLYLSKPRASHHRFFGKRFPHFYGKEFYTIQDCKYILGNKNGA